MFNQATIVHNMNRIVAKHLFSLLIAVISVTDYTRQKKQKFSYTISKNVCFLLLQNMKKKIFFWEHKNRIHVDKYANINFPSFSHTIHR